MSGAEKRVIGTIAHTTVLPSPSAPEATRERCSVRIACHLYSCALEMGGVGVRETRGRRKARGPARCLYARKTFPETKIKLLSMRERKYEVGWQLQKSTTATSTDIPPHFPFLPLFPRCIMSSDGILAVLTSRGRCFGPWLRLSLPPLLACQRK